MRLLLRSRKREVGGGEIRMQSQQASICSKIAGEAVPRNVSAWQFTSDSDNVCLALLAFEKRKLY